MWEHSRWQSIFLHRAYSSFPRKISDISHTICYDRWHEEGPNEVGRRPDAQYRGSKMIKRTVYFKEGKRIKNGKNIGAYQQRGRGSL